LSRLVDYVGDQRVVLRAVCVTAKEYLGHWRRSSDWESKTEDPALCQALQWYLPERLWVVEVSVPELFPANLRKAGEIVLDASRRPAPGRESGLFVLARVPGRLLFSPEGKPSSPSVPSRLQSHTPLLGCDRGAPSRSRSPD
jgi:hypothetical protein